MDCAYYSDDLLEVNLDPGRELKDLLEARGLQGLEDSCPQCFQNQRKLVSTACITYTNALALQHLLHAQTWMSAHTAQHSTAQHNVAQHSTAQHGMAQLPSLPSLPTWYIHQATTTVHFDMWRHAFSSDQQVFPQYKGGPSVCSPWDTPWSCSLGYSLVLDSHDAVEQQLPFPHACCYGCISTGHILTYSIDPNLATPDQDLVTHFSNR